MLIVCPSCASRYELDAAKLGPAGRKVRCAACKTLWHVEPEVAFPEAPAAEDTQALLNEELQRALEIEAQVSAVAAEQEGEPALDDDAPGPAPRPRAWPARSHGGRARPAGRGLAMPAALAIAGLLLIGGLAWQRNLAVRAAPQLATIFEALGLPVNVRGLSLTAIEGGLVQDGQSRFLVVEGDVTNITSGIAAVPPIEVAVQDAAGQTLYTWTTDPPRARLEPAELMHFRARLASPPDAGKSVRVRFGDAKASTVAKAD